MNTKILENFGKQVKKLRLEALANFGKKQEEKRANNVIPFRQRRA